MTILLMQSMYHRWLIDQTIIIIDVNQYDCLSSQASFVMWNVTTSTMWLSQCVLYVLCECNVFANIFSLPSCTVLVSYTLLL